MVEFTELLTLPGATQNLPVLRVEVVDAVALEALHLFAVHLLRNHHIVPTETKTLTSSLVSSDHRQRYEEVNHTVSHLSSKAFRSKEGKEAHYYVSNEFLS